MTKKNNPLIINLIVTLAAFYLFHNLYMLAVILLYKMEYTAFFLNLPVSLVFDCGILTGLISLKDKFVYEESGVMLKKLNLANLISLFRITALPVIFILLLYIQDYPLLPVFFPYVFLVFISDFIDGLIARWLHQITKIGRYIDASSDYIILIAISVIFLIYNLMPVWFFILVIIRLLSYSLGLIFISIRKKHLVYKISFLGKVSIFLIMFLYAFELITLLKLDFLNMIKPWLEYAIACVLVISLIEKIISLFKITKQA